MVHRERQAAGAQRRDVGRRQQAGKQECTEERQEAATGTHQGHGSPMVIVTEVESEPPGPLTVRITPYEACPPSNA